MRRENPFYLPHATVSRPEPSSFHHPDTGVPIDPKVHIRAGISIQACMEDVLGTSARVFGSDMHSEHYQTDGSLVFEN